MININIPYISHTDHAVDTNNLPYELIHAVMVTREQYPEILNESLELDKLSTKITV